MKDRDGLDIEIQALAFPTICAPDTMIKPRLVEKLTELNLADYPCTEGNDSIDVLTIIGILSRETSSREMVQLQ